ncbi:hypothetical protein ACGF13_09025 [Kitasatospora sp. NPDC048286]|uniref:hypothetical protein n=1 Tax=Kitasatospora sp. NPDC048286 TaxID=3364047 RepID=UPI0037120B9E
MDRDGVLRPIVIRLGPPDATIVALLDDGSPTEISGTDYLDCLTRIRRRLEQDGRLLCCQGARPGVHASGQLRQFTGGREAYVHDPNARGEALATVDVFDPARPEEVVSLDEQRAAFFRLWKREAPRQVTGHE